MKPSVQPEHTPRPGYDTQNHRKTASGGLGNLAFSKSEFGQTVICSATDAIKKPHPPYERTGAVRSRTSKTRSDWVWITVIASLELAGPNVFARRPFSRQTSTVATTTTRLSPHGVLRDPFVSEHAGKRRDHAVSGTSARRIPPRTRCSKCVCQCWRRRNRLDLSLSRAGCLKAGSIPMTPSYRHRASNARGILILRTTLRRAEKSPAGRGWWGSGVVRVVSVYGASLKLGRA